MPNPQSLLTESRQRAEALLADPAPSPAALAEAQRWLERGRRLSPNDPTGLLLLAMLQLRLRPPAAAALFAELAARHDVGEIWVGLAAARRLAGDLPGAAAAAAAGLARHALLPPLAALAGELAAAAGRPGWCGLDGAGRLTVMASGPAELRLDGRRLHGTRLPPAWRLARRLTVRCQGQDLLGSPIDLAAIRRLEGFVEAVDGGLAGWAWHPADPQRQPVLTVLTAEGVRRRVVAEDGDISVAGTTLLRRPRRFAVAAEQLRDAAGPVRVMDGEGADVLGSPLDPGAARRAAVALARGLAGAPAGAGWEGLPLPVLPPAGQPAVSRRICRVAVVLVAAAGCAAAALARVLRTIGPEVAVIVAEVGAEARAEVGAEARAEVGAEARAEVGAAGALPADAARRVTRLHAAGTTWTEAAVAGLRRTDGRDVALLDAGCHVAAGWLEELRAVCLAQPDRGSASPLGATEGPLMLSVDPAELPAVATLALGCNRGVAVDIPVARERCVYLRRACLAQTGLPRGMPFAQGEGAIADFCLRAAALGWRHVAAPGVVVTEDAAPAGPDWDALRARNRAVLAALHPGLERRLALPSPAPPAPNLPTPNLPATALTEARRRLAAARWRQAARGAAPGAGAVVLISHGDGGGVERVLRARCDHWQAAGQRTIVLRPGRREDGADWCLVSAGTAPGDDDLRYHLPEELPALAALLRPDRVRLIELHHLLGHHHAVVDLARRLRVPYDLFVHDHALFCPRILLVGRERRYCGEPALAGCIACIADCGSLLEETIGVAELRQRSAADLAAARRVIAPSDDTAARLRRQFPGVRAEVTPWQQDAPVPAPRQAAAGQSARAVVCVVGAIGLEKGFEVLLDCARDAAARDLALEFVVVGHTLDDRRLLDTGRVFVTGVYAEADAVALIEAQQAALGFIPSVWPETWCYALGHVWAAGLAAVAFDLGAPAERIRRCGAGHLLPLGLQPGAINQALLAWAAPLGQDPAMPPPIRGAALGAAPGAAPGAAGQRHRVARRPWAAPDDGSRTDAGGRTGAGGSLTDA